MKFIVVDADFQIRRGVAGGGYPDPEIRGEGPGLKKSFFGPSGLSLVLK